MAQEQGDQPTAREESSRASSGKCHLMLTRPCLAHPGKWWLGSWLPPWKYNWWGRSAYLFSVGTLAKYPLHLRQCCALAEKRKQRHTEGL